MGCADQITKVHSPLPDCPKCGANSYRSQSSLLIIDQGVADISYVCTKCEAESQFRYRHRTGGLFFVKEAGSESSWNELEQFKEHFTKEQLSVIPPIPHRLIVFHQPKQGIWNQLRS